MDTKGESACGGREGSPMLCCARGTGFPGGVTGAGLDLEIALAAVQRAAGLGEWEDLGSLGSEGSGGR